MKTIKKLLAAVTTNLLIFVVCFSLAIPAQAVTFDELANKLQELQIQLTQLQSQLPQKQVLAARVIVVNNRDEFVKALIGAQGGDEIRLAQGDYGSVSMAGGTYNQINANGVKYAGKTPSPSSPVTITSLDKSKPALFKNLLFDTPNWIVDGLAFETEPGIENRGMISFRPGAKNSVVRNSTFMVKLDGDYRTWDKDKWRSLSLGGSAIQVTGIASNAENVLIENNYVKHIQYGISLDKNAKNNIVRRNTVEAFVIDGIRVLSDYTLIEDNLIKNSVQLSNTHNDCFQSWSLGSTSRVGTGEVVGVTIRGNTCISNEDQNHPFPAKTQGIGFFDGVYRNITIENNIIITDTYHGIALYGGIDSVIRNNTVIDINAAKPGPAWILVTSSKKGVRSSNVLVEKNIAHKITSTRVIGTTTIVTAKAINNSIINFTDFPAAFVNVAAFDVRVKPGLIPVGVGATPRVVGSTLQSPQLRGYSAPTGTTTPIVIPPTPPTKPPATTTPVTQSKPVAAFTISNKTPVVGEVVTFNAQTSRFATSWVWDDAVGSVGQYPLGNGETITFKFNKPSTKKIRLTTSNQYGTDVLIIPIEVKAALPSNPTTTPGTAASTSGKTVYTTDVLNVRSTANGTKIGTQAKGARGVQLGIPATTIAGFTWVKVDFATGVDGFVSQNYLANSTTTPSSLSAIQVQIDALLKQIEELQKLLTALKAVQ